MAVKVAVVGANEKNVSSLISLDCSHVHDKLISVSNGTKQVDKSPKLQGVHKVTGSF